MTKTIWIVSVYTQSPEYDTHLRHRKFAKYLIQRGYNVIIITGSYLRVNKIDLLQKKQKYGIFDYDGLKYVHIKTIQNDGNNLKRIFAIFQFSYRLFIYRNKFEKPDILIHNLHTPFDALIYFIAKKFKSKYITEVWDLWPEAFIETGFIPKKNPLLKLAYKIENFLYYKADKMIFSMEGGDEYIKDKKWDIGSGGNIDLSKYRYINNGVDLEEFEYNKQNYIIDDADLTNNDLFKVIYLGSIRLVNDVKKIVDAAKELIDYPKIKFYIFGDGNDRLSLEKYCIENNITNVIFKNKWINIKYVPFVVSSSSINILNYKNYDIYKYGGSQGKLFQYLASGKPICSNVIMGYNPIEKYNVGIVKDFKTSKDYAEAIKKFYFMDSDEYKGYCDRSKKAAKEFDYNTLSNKMLDVINEIK